ncbi:MAG: hypothetical protein RL077_352 [Verrucomicrobiota bacterium]|jgi:hypothetical protein
MNDSPAASAKPMFASATAFVAALFGNFSVDTFSKLCTALAALVAVAYSVWKWRKEALRLKHEEARQAAAARSGKTGTGGLSA